MSIDVVREVRDLLDRRGGDAYFGEAVTQREHALQCAWLASEDGADAALIVAALLHDIGHLLLDFGEQVADRGVNTKHENVGQLWLGRFFGPEVIEPVRLHVIAKRYLCAVDPAYEASLSDASRQSLRLQGGPLRGPALAAFLAEPFSPSAIRLRRWDDCAKRTDVEVPDLTHYEETIRAVARYRPEPSRA